MASEFLSLNEIDTKELRKKLGFPITKKLKYLYKENNTWCEKNIVNYEIVEIYQPSGTHSLMITLETGEQIRILADYLADMQNPLFINEDGRVPTELKKADSDKNEADITSTIHISVNNKIGKRIQATPETYIIVDLETTGTNHFTDEIIEIGAIKYVNGTETDRYSALVKAKKTVSKKIEKITGITNELLETKGIDKATAMMSLYTFLGNDIVIGHNIATFDSNFIEDAYQDVLNCHFPNDYIDTLLMARKTLPELERHRLEDLSEVYHVDYSKAHRAVEDCIINHFIYENMAFGRVLNENVSKEYLLNVVDTYKNEDVIDEENFILIDESESSGWKERLTHALNQLIVEKNLPEKSLCLMANKGRQHNIITSYSVCIYEPDLIEDKRNVERNSIVTRITEGKLKSSPDILTIEPKNQAELTELKLPDDATVYAPEKALAYIRMDQNSDNFISYIISSVNYALEHYTTKAATFACCARYEQCSDAKKCIHVNQLYSKACQYRKNLESEKIFYGKNRNI